MTPKAMILAAGFGTRLRPLSLELPKPLVWVGDRPAIAHIAARLVAAGVTDIVVNTHHRADAFSPDLLARIPGNLSIVTEGEILGTGGGLANAAPLLGEGDVVVWNGDILAPLDVTALLASHRAAPRGATLAIAPCPPGQGTIGVDAAGHVARLRGERFGIEASGGDFLGISVVSVDLRRTLPIPGCLVGEGLLPWLRAGRPIGTFAAAVPWDDIGSVDAYLRANARWLTASGRASYIGEDAAISPKITLSGSIVGEGAVVHGEGLLEACVIWPGASATAPLARTVVTTSGRVVQVQVTPESTSPP